jgi:26S proteasome regulatory subunit T4
LNSKIQKKKILDPPSFNGADMRNICTEAGMFAIRAERDYTIEEDYMRAARKISDNKKLEGTLDYDKSTI